MTEALFTQMLVPEYIREIPPALLKRSIKNNQSNKVYFGGQVNDDGGWRYYIGANGETGTITVNSTGTDTQGVRYTDY